MKILFVVVVLGFFSSHAFANCEQVKKSQDVWGNQISDFADDDNPASNEALILPPTGGENIADKFLAVSLCQRGLNAVILNYRQDSADLSDLGSHDRITEEMLQWVNDLLSKRDQKFVIVGSSLGSLYASMAFGESLIGSASYPSLSKIEGAILTVAGGSLAEILATSTLPSVEAQQKQRLHQFMFADLSQYQKALDAAITLDPLRFARAAAHAKVLMFSSTNDIIVPTKTQNQLWEAWGEPERHRYFTDHMWTIVTVYFTQAQKIYDFSQGIFSNP